MTAKYRVCLLTVCMSLIGIAGWGSSLSVNSFKDARVINGDPNPDGTSIYLSLYAGWRDYSLLSFDLSSIPADAVVQSAALTLYVNQLNGGNPTNDPMQVYRLTRDWVESQVTWFQYDGTNSWTSPGGDYAGIVYATSTANPANALDPVTWDVTSLVQQWVTGTYSNYGMEIIANNGNASPIGLHFGARETENPAYRPLLLVNYVVPEPATLGLALVGVGLLVASRRRSPARAAGCR